MEQDNISPLSRLYKLIPQMILHLTVTLIRMLYEEFTPYTYLDF